MDAGGGWEAASTRKSRSRKKKKKKKKLNCGLPCSSAPLTCGRDALFSFFFFRFLGSLSSICSMVGLRRPPLVGGRTFLAPKDQSCLPTHPFAPSLGLPPQDLEEESSEQGEEEWEGNAHAQVEGGRGSPKPGRKRKRKML